MEYSKVNLTPIKSLSHEELCAQFEDMGLKRFRVQQVEQWLWGKGCTSFEEMTNLSKQLRSNLASAYSIDTAHMVNKQVSADGTRKYLFSFSDNTCVESVGIPSENGARLTVCFSTQAGCAMGCTFCATGRSGLSRNLSIGEMFDQIQLVGKDFGMRVSNVVAMGQGEPFLNFDAVLSVLKIINDSKVGLGIGARHITVSTCGILEGIKRFEEVPEQFTLAISLHSAVQKTRDELMPGVRHMPLDALRAALKDYGEHTGRRPTLEYAPIEGINDDEDHVEALISFCRGMLSHVNLIPLNPIDTSAQTEGMMEPSSRIRAIEHELNAAGIETSIRASRGGDIDGACGQLRQRYL